MSLYLGENLISGQATLVGESRNIGQIIPSAIPLTDAGLHLLDGALIQGSGIYSAFVTYIAGLRTQYSSLFTTEANWQSTVTQYGVCGKFVYNSTNNTVRLPKITGIIEGTTDVTALGDLVEAGLPNITGALWGGRNTSSAYTGAFRMTGNSSSKTSRADWGENLNSAVTFDASRSSSIYGNSTTVQPQTIKALYYIVIATSTKTDVQVDIDDIATDLNGKADTDLSNITESANVANKSLSNVNNSGKILMSGMGMPSNTYNSLAIGASGTTYTAPTNGYFYIYGGSGNDTSYHHITAFYNSANNWDSPTLRTYNNAPSAALTLFIPVKKQQTIRIEYNVTMRRIVFVYAQGSESEAQ